MSKITAGFDVQISLPFVPLRFEGIKRPSQVKFKYLLSTKIQKSPPLVPLPFVPLIRGNHTESTGFVKVQED